MAAAKPVNHALQRLQQRLQAARAADPEAQSSEVQDMMMAEIRRHYLALLEKRGISAPLSSAIIEDVRMPAPALANESIDTETGEIVMHEPDTSDSAENVPNLLSTVDNSVITDAISCISTEANESELEFLAELGELLNLSEDHK